jgi:YYY domain-containing protein
MGFVDRREFGRVLRRHGAALIWTEGIFFAALMFGLWLVSCHAAIDPDSERMMDYAMLQSVLRTDSFPQQDLWMAGAKVNYYYFGYVIAAVVRWLGNMPLPVFFNAMVALVYALSFSAAFGWGWAFSQRKRYGWLAMLMLMLMGNLNGLVQVVLRRPCSAVDWFGGSRVIPGTINEFPWFSLLWGDLHPYMLSFPIVFIVLYMALQLLRTEPGRFRRHPCRAAAFIAAFAVLCGSMLAVNTWDYPAWFMVVAGAVFIRVCVTECTDRPAKPGMKTLLHSRGLYQALGFCVMLFAGGMAAYAPYLLAFQQERAVRWVSFSRSPFSGFVQMFGTQLTVLTGCCLVWIAHARPAGQERRKAWMLMLFGVASAIGLFQQITYLYLLALLLLAMVPAWRLISNGLSRGAVYSAPEQNAEQTDVRVLTLFTLALLFLGAAYALVCEFIYVDDHYTGMLERQNTVFKVYLQVWFIWSAAAVLGVYLLNRRWCTMPFVCRITGWGMLCVLLAGNLVYTVCGTRARIRQCRSPVTLDGTLALQKRYPADWQAIQWFRNNVDGQPVVAEAVGHAYDWSSRFATFCGVPTVLGWLNHEAGWRNTYDTVMPRKADVEILYTTESRTQAEQLLDRYRIRYVIVGPLETMRYPGPGLRKFPRFMDEVYNRKDVKIYRRRDE